MLVKIKENRKWGYYNTETKYDIPCIYEDADNFNNGYAIVKASYNEYYIIDEFGNKINPNPFTHIELHSLGVYRVRYKNIEYDSFIDQSGNFVTSLGAKLPVEMNAAEFIAPLTENIYLTYRGDLYGLFHLTKGYIINNLPHISRLNDVLFVIRQDESKQYGVCNTAGKIIVPVEYASISILDDDLILASQDSWHRAGDVYNHQGDKLFYTNSRAESIGNNLYRIFYDANKYFVYNPISNEVCFSIKTPNPIPLEHLYYSEFINGYSIIINKDHKYGLIDIDNNMVINSEYDDLYIENGFAYVAKNNSYKDYQGYHKNKKAYGIIDLKNFNTIIECQFDSISSFVNHHAKVTKDYYSGYVNDQGEATIKLTHDKISETENPYIVQLSRTGQYPNIRYQFITGEYAFIHPQGHFVALPKEYQVCGDFSEGRILVQHQTSYNYAYADEFGKIVIRLNPGIEGGKFNGERASIWIDRCLYRTLYGGEDTSLCTINKAGAFVVPDGTCEVVIENSALSFIRPFEGEIARAFCDGKWVLINKTGQYISANKFDEISEFIDNQAIATIRDNNRREYHIITNNGEPLIEHKFKSIELVNGEYYSTDIGNISKNGKFIANGLEIEMLYDSCIYCNEGYILVSRGNLKGVLDSNGKKLLNCLYNNISYVGNEHLLCSTEDSFLLFNCRTNEGVKLDNIKTCKVISDNVILITRPNKDSAIINSKGEILYQEHDLDITGTYDDLVIYKRNNRSTVGIISISKGILLEDVFNSILIDTETNSIIATKDDHRQRYDFNGKKVLMLNDKLFPLSDKYEACGDYYCGLARVKKHYPELQCANRKGKSPRSYRTLFHMTHHPDAQGNMDKRDFQEEKESDQILRSWGYIDTDGNEVIPCQFNNADDFSEGLAAVSYFYHWGFIDTCGEFVIARKYKEVRGFHEGYAAVKTDSNLFWSYILNNGQVAFHTKIHDNVYDVSSQTVRYKDYKGYGFINTEGETIISGLKYAEDFVNNRALVRINEDSDLFTINQKGDIVFKLEAEDVLIKQYFIDFNKVNYYAEANIIITERNGLKGLITAKGMTLPTIYPVLRIAEDKTHLIVVNSDGNRQMEMSFDGKYIITNQNCKRITFESEYRSCKRISQNFYLVSTLEQNYGIVNDSGIEIIPCIYQEIELSKDESYFHCVRYGNYSGPFEHYTPDCNAAYEDWDENGNSFMHPFDTHYYRIVYNINGAQVILNEGNEIVLPKNYLATGNTFHDGLCPVLDNSGWGFVDTLGKEIIPCKYSRYSDFKEGRSIVRDDNGWHAINTIGTVIIGGKDYSSISEFNDGLAEITLHSFASRNKEGKVIYEKRVINNEGQLQIVNKENILYLTKEYIWYNIKRDQIQIYDGQYWGLLDLDLNVIIPCKYKSPFDFICPLNPYGKPIVSKDWHNPTAFAIVESGSGYGLINDLNEEIIPLTYESIERIGLGIFNNCAKFYAKHKNLPLYSIYDKLGKLLTSIPCKSIESISANYSRFEIYGSHNEYGLTKDNGELLCTGFKEVGNESEGMIPIKLGSNWAYLKYRCGIVGEGLNLKSASCFRDGLGIVSIWNGKQQLYGAIDHAGNYIISPVYNKLTYTGSSFKGLISITNFDSEEVCLNNKGEILLVSNDAEPLKFTTYHACTEVSDGIFRVVRDNRIGFVDSKGEIILPLRNYPNKVDLPYYKNGKFYIKENSHLFPSRKDNPINFELDKDGCIITLCNTERIALPFEYTWAKEWVNNSYLPVMIGDNWGIINKDFVSVSSFEYSCIIGIKGSNAMAMKKEGTLYKLDLNTCTASELQYSYSNSNSKYIIITKKLIENRGFFSNNEKYQYGIIDFAGNEILECKYDKITFDGFERPEERDYVYDDGYSQDELDAMYRDAFEDDPDAQWNIW